LDIIFDENIIKAKLEILEMTNFPLQNYIISFILFVILIPSVKAQEQSGFLLKTNLLNLVAKRPTISIEKTFAKKYGLELSYTSGELNIGHYYKYDGFLLRAKKYTREIKTRDAIPFYGAYIGNLNRKIVRDGYYESWLFNQKEKNFEASSVRVGGNFGVLFIPGKRFALEGSTGIGYGKYISTTNYTQYAIPKGYFDFQLWLSVGYYF